MLAEQDKFQFQWWALGLVGARPVEQKKGADHGIDGKILFRDDLKASKAEQIIIQVKGGKTGVKDVRDLRGVLDREKAAMGVLISLQPPTGPMEAEAASAGFYTHKMNQQQYPRLQLRTVKELMEGQGHRAPAATSPPWTRRSRRRRNPRRSWGTRRSLGCKLERGGNGHGGAKPKGKELNGRNGLSKGAAEGRTRTNTDGHGLKVRGCCLGGGSVPQPGRRFHGRETPRAGGGKAGGH